MAEETNLDENFVRNGPVFFHNHAFNEYTLHI